MKCFALLGLLAAALAVQANPQMRGGMFGGGRGGERGPLTPERKAQFDAMRQNLASNTEFQDLKTKTSDKRKAFYTSLKDDADFKALQEKKKAFSDSLKETQEYKNVEAKKKAFMEEMKTDASFLKMKEIMNAAKQEAGLTA
jgi:hypothetical protein